MRTYSLIFFRDGLGQARRIEFDAADSSGALSPAIYDKPGRVAELWDGDTKLARFRSSRLGLWEILSA
ncbi:hypothetical protein NT2_12_01480 [Caenibius tardaugens NBRC 16725]|uniref:Uncharacterized protein n=1 Tax=Caenibius tardaugens NBRC 16725 TaxID=1219035 RepID=U2YPP5_9SPHN|nr:hypothetical protein EGO55_10425 [Caenibius tardaugens NBRC 16725]GAD50890.1 hypothetical protein NT2_12_01480 [Caenibius tardaugens NBRC 16725]